VHVCTLFSETSLAFIDSGFYKSLYFDQDDVVTVSDSDVIGVSHLFPFGSWFDGVFCAAKCLPDPLFWRATTRRLNFPAQS